MAIADLLSCVLFQYSERLNDNGGHPALYGQGRKIQRDQILVKIQIFEKIFKTPLKMFGGDQQPLSDTIHPCINVAPFTNFSADSRGSAESQWYPFHSFLNRLKGVSLNRLFLQCRHSGYLFQLVHKVHKQFVYWEVFVYVKNLCMCKHKPKTLCITQTEVCVCVYTN